MSKYEPPTYEFPTPEDEFPELVGPCTLQEVAEYMGISRERVRQIEEGALNKIRRKLNDYPQEKQKLRWYMEYLEAQRELMKEDL